MIEMLVRIHEVADRLVRDQPLRLGDDRVGTLIAGSALDNDDVILEVNRDTRVAAANVASPG